MPLKNAQYDAVMRHYDEIREKNRAAQSARTEEIYWKIPEIIALDDETASRSLDAAKLRVADPDADLTSYQAEMQRITARKHALLAASGYPADYLELRYDCQICKDTGFVEGRHCVCFDRAAAEIVYGRDSLRDVIAYENFEHFSLEWYSSDQADGSDGMTPREAAERAREAVLALPNRAGTEDANLYIYGNTGVGKTFLSHCAAKEAIDAGRSVLRFSSGEFFDLLADAAFKRGGGGSAARRLIEECDLLILDDLGTELPNAFVGSELFRVVDARIAGLRSTIISSNLSLKELAQKYSERVFSRISSHYTLVRLMGDDIRLIKKLKER